MAIQVLIPGNEDIINQHAAWVANQNFYRVLDVGGREKPLRAATHVMDLFSYETRRVDTGRGDLPERFSKETWLAQDVNATPWAFEPDYFDYVWCCQVLEDIRDPLAVCKEMQRVAKAGFISTVHRSYESRTIQYDGVVGYHHHRWLIEAFESTNTLAFTWKSPILHVNPDMRPTRIKDWLLNIVWSDYFHTIERFTGGDDGQYRELQEYKTRENL